jgi:hypothetical protein
VPGFNFIPMPSDGEDLEGQGFNSGPRFFKGGGHRHGDGKRLRGNGSLVFASSPAHLRGGAAECSGKLARDISRIPVFAAQGDIEMLTLSTGCIGKDSPLPENAPVGI